MTNEHIRKMLLDKGCSNLHDFGYNDAAPTNITKVYVFRKMFDRMLEDNKGTMTAQVDAVIESLRNEIKAQDDKESEVQS